MVNYLEYLSQRSTQWEPYAIPHLEDSAWLAAFKRACEQGRSNLAHAWLWELNQYLNRAFLSKPCIKVQTALACHADKLVVFGPYFQHDVTDKWLVTGLPQNLAMHIVMYTDDYGYESALKKLYSDNAALVNEGIIELGKVLQHKNEVSHVHNEARNRLLHNLVWSRLRSLSAVCPAALEVAYLLIVRQIFQQPVLDYGGDAVAHAWREFTNKGYERSLFTPEQALHVRNTILTRPLSERLSALIFLSKVYLSDSTRASDLSSIVDDGETLYNWSNIQNPCVCDILCQWLPEIEGGLRVAKETGIPLWDLYDYVMDFDANDQRMLLPAGEYC